MPGEKYSLKTGGKLYVADGERLQVYDTDAGCFFPPQYYRPLFSVATPPSGGGTFLESLNLLTGATAQRFSPDGVSDTFVLAAKNLESVDYVMVGGTSLYRHEFQADIVRGTVKLNTVPAKGIDSVDIGYTRRQNISNIDGCRFVLPFGGDNDTRLFTWGNEAYPSHLWWSGIPTHGNGLYFPADCFNTIGNGDPITSLTRHYDRLLVFTRSASYYLYASQKTDDMGIQYTSFPVFTLSPDRGSLMEGPGILMDNQPLSVGESGLYRWVSTYQRDERNAVLFSRRACETLGKADLSNAGFFDRESKGELWCVLDDRILIYHYRLDVFYLYKGFLPTAFAEMDKTLYFGMENGMVCLYGDMFTDNNTPIIAVWESTYLDFGYPHLRKNVDRCDILLRAESKTNAHITWITDKDTGEGDNPIALNGGLFDFARMDFAALRMDTTLNNLRFTRRIGAKRINVFKLRLQNQHADSSLRLLSLVLGGTLLCK